MKKVRKGYSKVIKAICEDCNGEGTITIPGAHLGHNRYDDDTVETCETCEGTGMVKVKKQVFTSLTIESYQPKQLEV